jgi:elongator complex protein 1
MDLQPLEHGDICCLTHLQQQRCISVIFSSGDISMYSLESGTMECVGSVDMGILAAQWSPDEEILVLVTGRRTLLEMTKEFEVLAEIRLDAEERGLYKSRKK